MFKMYSLISCVKYLIIIQLSLPVVVADYVIYGTKSKPLTTVSIKRRNGKGNEGNFARRQGGGDEYDYFGPGGPGKQHLIPMGDDGKPKEAPYMDPANQAAHRYTTVTINTIKLARTPPIRSTFNEQCDYIASYCLKAYNTGRLCARTVHHYYDTFKNYCMLDYVNCIERYEMWQVVHMGQCYDDKPITEYIHYEYRGDSFLDKDIISDDQKIA